jgi:hypothetical protein
MEGDIAGALRETEAWLAQGRSPTRFQARALLVPIGLGLLEGPHPDAEAALERVRGWIAAARPAWEDAVLGELSMAATEHVRSVDPRWLDHPRYDFVYTVDARHSLEARLRCAEALGIEVPDDLLEAIERADLLLEPHLARLRALGQG